MFLIIMGVAITVSLCNIGGICSRAEEAKIKKDEESYLYCDDDCYLCKIKCDNRVEQ